MFCSKCGNLLPDDAKFCNTCGAPVKTLQEASPVPQQPAGIPDETVNIQAPKPQPLMDMQNFSAQMSGGAAASEKKTKKGLAIGLSLGCVLVAVLAVIMVFVLRTKDSGSAYGHSSVSIGTSEITHDEEYIYYLGEQGGGDKTYIMRIGYQSDAKPEIVYETDRIQGDGWYRYPLGMLFLWNNKICFLELTKSDIGEYAVEYDFNWISKDGKEQGVLASYGQLSVYDDILNDLSGVYFCEDSLIFSTWQSFCRLDLNTGEICRQQDLIELMEPACFVAYADGYYYYVIPDFENNVMGETLYRKTAGSEPEEIGDVSVRNNDDVGMFNTFVSKGDYLYFADKSCIYRIHKENGNVETLVSYEDCENRFAITETGIYYFRDMSLCFFDLETLEETAYDLPESIGGIPDLIYAGRDEECWFIQWADSFDYWRFMPDEDIGSFVFWDGTIWEDGSIQYNFADN